MQDFDVLWKDLMTKQHLAYCDQYVKSLFYTYRQDSLNQTKFNDHFIVSKSLLEKDIFHDHVILDEGANTSDHLPLLMKMSLQLQTSNSSSIIAPSQKKLDWKKMSDQDKANYASSLEYLLVQRQTPLNVSLCRHACGCRNQSCIDDIQKEYNEICSCLISASNSLPHSRAGIEKDWWTPELTQLRDKSLAIQELWISEGRPRQGPTYNERLRVRAAYKNTIRQAKKAPKQAAWNRLHSAMETQDTDSFWKWWRSVYSKNKNHFPPVVDGHSSKVGIASAFQRSFEANSKPNNPVKVDELNSLFDEKYQSFSLDHTRNWDCEKFCISLENTIDAVFSMKPGKSADDD